MKDEEIDEDWAKAARMSQIGWATENPYGEDESSNEEAEK